MERKISLSRCGPNGFQPCTLLFSGLVENPSLVIEGIDDTSERVVNKGKTNLDCFVNGMQIPTNKWAVLPGHGEKAAPLTLRDNYSILVDNHLHRNSQSEDEDRRINILLYSEAGASPGEAGTLRYLCFGQAVTAAGLLCVIWCPDWRCWRTEQLCRRMIKITKKIWKAWNRNKVLIDAVS